MGGTYRASGTTGVGRIGRQAGRAGGARVGALHRTTEARTAIWRMWAGGPPWYLAAVTDWWRRRPPVVQDLLAGGAVAVAWFTAFHLFRQHGWSPRQPETFVVAGIWTAGGRRSAEGAPGVGVRRRRRGLPARLRRDVAERVPPAAGARRRVHGDELGAGPPSRGVDRLHGGQPRPLLEPRPRRPRPGARRPPLRLAQRALHRAGDGERGGARVAHAPAGRDLPRPRRSATPSSSAYGPPRRSGSSPKSAPASRASCTTSSPTT